MSAIKYVDSLCTLRAIRHELNRLFQKNSTSKDVSVKHIINLFRDNQVTERRYCRPAGHYKYFADTYLTYLKSSRLQDELTSKYFNKGDRSIADSAKLVGLELPEQSH